MSHVKVLCLALVVTLALSCSAFGAKKGPDARSYVAGRYALTLEGVRVGFLKSAEGGDVSADVVAEKLGADHIVRKHVGRPKYEDIEIQVGLGMGKQLYEWIRNSWSMKYTRMKGSITALDFNYQPVSEQEFFEALITETTIPAAAGASKDPAYITVKLSPEHTRSVKAGGKSEPGTAAKEQQKIFLPSNFRLDIDGLDCKGVSRVESFTVKQSVVQDDIGGARDAAKEPSAVEFPNLTITLSDRGAESWRAWHESFVIKGNNGQDQEKNGSLTFLAPNLKEELLTIRFSNMGIFRLKPEKPEAGNEAIRRLVAELYVEKMDFEYKPAAVAGADTTGTTPAEPAPTLRPSVSKTVRRAG